MTQRICPVVPHDTPSLTIRRSGFALFLVLLAIVLVSALTAATAFRTHEDALGVHAMTLQQHALLTAEHALQTVLQTTNPATLDSAPVGATLSAATTTDTTNSASTWTTTTVRITKTTPTLLWLTASATARHGPDHVVRTIGLSATLGPTHITPVPEYPWADL